MTTAKEPQIMQHIIASSDIMDDHDWMLNVPLHNAEPNMVFQSPTIFQFPKEEERQNRARRYRRKYNQSKKNAKIQLEKEFEMKKKERDNARRENKELHILEVVLHGQLSFLDLTKAVMDLSPSLPPNWNPQQHLSCEVTWEDLENQHNQVLAKINSIVSAQKHFPGRQEKRQSGPDDNGETAVEEPVAIWMSIFESVCLLEWGDMVSQQQWKQDTRSTINQDKLSLLDYSLELSQDQIRDLCTAFKTMKEYRSRLEDVLEKVGWNLTPSSSLPRTMYMACQGSQNLLSHLLMLQEFKTTWTGLVKDCLKKVVHVLRSRQLALLLLHFDTIDLRSVLLLIPAFIHKLVFRTGNRCDLD